MCLDGDMFLMYENALDLIPRIFLRSYLAFVLILVYWMLLNIINP